MTHMYKTCMYTQKFLQCVIFTVFAVSKATMNVFENLCVSYKFLYYVTKFWKTVDLCTIELLQ